MQVRWQSLVKGLATRVPLASRWANATAGSAVGARYFYAVWLRHLVCLSRARPGFRLDVVAELGPGDALGIGLCAVLSGARRYIGLDRVAFGLRANNLGLLDELVELFHRRAPIPDDRELPGVHPRLVDYRFPHHILTDERLSESLAPQNIARIRDAIRSGVSDDAPISYAAPWDERQMIRPGSVDLLISQAVLEHVDDIDGTYRAMRGWLRPTGLMSHRIDYSCHGITHDWYGHWTVPPALWKVVRGDRAYLINRRTHSTHLAALEANGFEVLACIKSVAERPAPSSQMRVQFVPADLAISGAYIAAGIRST